MTSITESAVGKVALSWLHDLGYTNLHSADIAPGTSAIERTDYGQVLLVSRLRSVLLPRLIYGQLRVPDAERFAAGAM